MPLPDRPLALRAGALALLALLVAGCSRAPDAARPATPPRITLGFLVKQPEEPWFQLEWKFAARAADELGFRLIRIGATDGEKVLAGIDTLAAAGAQGFVICTPDPRLGPAITAKARTAGLKVIAVDDQFVGPDGRPMAGVPYLGISASRIGEEVGRTLAAVLAQRGWAPADTRVCLVTFDELATARERTEGIRRALAAAGLPEDRFLSAPVRTPDIPGAFDAVTTLLTRQSGVRHWLVGGFNDNAVLGAVRALEGAGVRADRAVAIGINGTDCLAELEKPTPTAFHGSMLLSAKDHGYRTCEMLLRWVRDGVEPPADTRTTGILITRGNFRQVLREQGIRE